MKIYQVHDGWHCRLFLGKSPEEALAKNRSLALAEVGEDADESFLAWLDTYVAEEVKEGSQVGPDGRATTYPPTKKTGA